jgi:hypothetical protein
VFGPHPRDYRAGIPKKVRQLARRSALNARAAEGSVLVVEKLVYDSPKTSRLMELLNRLGVAGKKVLVLTHGNNTSVFLSGRNVPEVEVMSYIEASAYDILWSEVVVVEQGAITGEVPAGNGDASSLDTKAPRARREPGAAKTKKKAAKAAAAAAEAEARPKKKAVKKARAAAPKKKPAAKKKSARTAAKKPAAKKAPKKKGGR